MVRATKFFSVLIIAGAALWLGVSTISTARSEAIKLVWRVDTGKPINIPPVVIGNRILVIPKGLALTALDKANGDIQWQYEPAQGVWSRGLSTDGSRAFVCLKGGDIAALNGQDGAVLWKTKLGIDCQRPPLVSDGALYVSTTFVGQGLPSKTFSGAKLFSINPADGTINWAFTTENYFLQSPTQRSGTVYVGGSYLDPAIVVDEGGPVRFYAIDSKSGRQKWTYQSEDGLPKALYATEDRVVFVGYQDFLNGLDAATGKLVWRRDTGNWVPSLIGHGDVVYYGSANTKVHAWDTRTGETHWQFNIPGGAFNYLLIKPVIVKDRMFFMSQKGTAFALNLDNGKEIWSHATGMDARTGPSVSGDTMFMGDSKGVVYAYKMLK